MNAGIKKTIFAGACVLILIHCPLGALEFLTTTGQLIQTSAYVAHVRVEDSRTVAGNGSIQDYTLTVLENLKGSLPGTVQVRVVSLQKQISPPGAEWIVILGNRTSAGYYPFRSLHWGRIEIFEREDIGQKILARPLTGMASAPNGNRYYSLQHFKSLVREIIKK